MFQHFSSSLSNIFQGHFHVIYTSFNIIITGKCSKIWLVPKIFHKYNTAFHCPLQGTGHLEGMGCIHNLIYRIQMHAYSKGNTSMRGQNSSTRLSVLSNEHVKYFLISRLRKTNDLSSQSLDRPLHGLPHYVALKRFPSSR